VRIVTRWVSSILVVALGATGVLILSSSQTDALSVALVVRHDSADRHAVARFTAEDAFPAGATDVLLARDDLFPDALAASYRAGNLGAPILLTGGATLDGDALLALSHLHATKVHLLGGTAAINDAVANQITGLGYTVDRVAGADRYETAALLASLAGAVNVATVAGKRTAIMASGVNFPDALAAGPLAYANRLPLLLTDPNQLRAVTKTALDTLNIQHVLLLGGTAAITEAVSNELVLSGRSVQRLAGADRYATGAAIADYARTTLGWLSGELVLATGLDFPDAEVAGPLGGKRQAPIVLVNGGLPAASAGVCTSTGSTVTKITVQGAASIVSTATVDQCKFASSAPTNKAAWLLADQFGAASYVPDMTYQFNSTGAANTIKRTSLGVYEVHFTGLGSTGGIVVATPVAVNSLCEVDGWQPVAGDEVATVRCYNNAGNAADAKFTALFQQRATAPNAMAYVWANAPASASYTPDANFQFNSSSALNTIKRVGVGEYSVVFPGLGGAGANFKDAVMVTSFGAAANRCRMESQSITSASASVGVLCNNKNGQRVDSSFTLIYARGGGLSPFATRWASGFTNDANSANYTVSPDFTQNSGGGSITVARTATGVFDVTFVGQGTLQGSHVQVNAFTSSFNHCNIASWGLAGSDLKVTVSCYDNDGLPTNERFDISVLGAP
jgi:putative cell wall-binding protein